MKKYLNYLGHLLLSILYGLICYIIAHLDTTTGLNFKFGMIDYFLVINVLFLFPFTLTNYRKWKEKKSNLKNTSKKQVEYMRKIDSQVAQAQLQSGSSNWNIRNTGDTLEFLISNFFLYFILFVFSLFIDIYIVMRLFFNSK